VTFDRKGGKPLGEAMISQKQFDKFVEDYNEDYLVLLERASTRHYECLISSFLILKDLYNVICTLYDNGGLTYTKLPFPLSFRADEQLLSQLGFDEEGIENIHGFLPYVKETQGMELEECGASDEAASCARASLR
jgi:hypothetical protein